MNVTKRKSASKRKTTKGRHQTRNTNQRRKKQGAFLRWWRSLSLRSLWKFCGLLVAVYLLILGYYFARPYLSRWSRHEIRIATPVVHGVDVSHYQGKIDWEKLGGTLYRGDSIRFAIIKATEGSDVLDETFLRNYQGARKQGLICGAYHFFSPTSSAEKQADFFIQHVQLAPNDLPPVLDVEKRGDYSPENLCAEVKTWLQRVEHHYGVKPIIYASYKFRQKYLADPALERYPYWIAHYYVDTLAYQGKWAFWQHTDVGTLEGIKGKVDMNVFNGGLEELLELTLHELPEDSLRKDSLKDSLKEQQK